MENLSATEAMSQTTPIVCEKCGNDVFTEGLMLRKVSRILMGDTKDGVLPIPVFTCTKCGHVNKEFLPKGIERKEEEKDSGLIIK